MTVAPPSPPPASRAGRVALVGRPNVGKSTLFNALLGEAIAITSPHPQTTRETVRGILTRKDAQFVLLDTPGVHAPRSRLGHRMNEAALRASRDSDALVWVVEPPRHGSELSAAEAAFATELPARHVVVAINKIDLMKDRSALLPLLASIGRSRSFEAIVPVSARREDGTGALLDQLRDLLPVQPFLFDPETISDQPVRFFIAEFVREQILRNTRQEVPHGTAVVVERFDESGPLPHIDVVVHVARESHKKIVVGAAGQMTKSIGTAARARVEQMLGHKVHLRLWVRTTPGWMDDDAKLRELGYGKEGEQ